MVLTIHHLGISQSERILWLCEELGLDYKLVLHKRSPLLSPESLKAVPGNKTGKSPFIEDSSNGVQLSESGAIAEYIISTYGNGKFAAKPSDSNFADYLSWFHYANGTLQPAFVTSMLIGVTSGPPEEMPKQFAQQRIQASLAHVDERLASNKWLAGNEFTAADIMTVYTVTTQRYFGPQVSLETFPNILRWLKECAARPAYQRAMEKGDPEMKLLLDAEVPEKGLLEVDGTNSDIWKKK